MNRKSILIVCCIVFFAFLFGCGEKIEPGNTEKKSGKVLKAPISEAKTTQQNIFYEAVGTVTAKTSSTISSKLMGTVRSVNVQEGDIVREGDVVVVIDQRQVVAELQRTQAGLSEARRAEASAESAMESAKASAELAKSTYNRYVELMKSESASRQEFDEVQARNLQAQAALSQTAAMLDAARFRIRQAEASVDGAKVGKQDSTVQSPYEGKVTAKMINVGDLASPGTPLITIEKEDQYCADLVLPEAHIQEVTVGQEVRVVIPALNDKEVVGQIGRILPIADARSRSFQIKVALPPKIQVKSGMFARVSIPVGGEGKLLIPMTSILERGQLTGIYSVDEKQIVHFRLIKTGKDYGESIEVITGLKEGEKYVVVPPPGLADGDKIEAQS